MSEFDDVNRYLESMYRVFYSLLAIADEARGREPRRVYTPFEQEPSLFFDDAYSAVVDAGVIIEDDELLAEAVATGNEFLEVLEEEGTEEDRFNFRYYFDPFVEMHRQAGLDV